MAVGFAAFSQQLKINGTSDVTSSWSVKITKIETIIPSGSEATDNSSACDESGSPKQCGDGLTASVSANLVSPGDSITYRIKLANKGSLDAALNHITLNANASNDIGYYVNKDKNNTTVSDTGYRLLEENGILNSMGDSNNLDIGYVYLTVYYKEYEGQTSPTGANKTVTATAKFDFIQSSSQVTPPTPSTPFVYAYHTDTKTIGSSTITDGVADYTQLSSYQNGTPRFLKYEIDGSNVIQNAWACFKYDFITDPVCLQGGDASYYGTSGTGNVGIIEGLASTFQEQGGTCSADSYGAECYVGELRVDAGNDGSVEAIHYSEFKYCAVGGNGSAYCH